MQDGVGQTGRLASMPAADASASGPVAAETTCRTARWPLLVALLASGLLAAAGLSGCGGSTADAVTTVSAARSAELVRADGTRFPAQAGDRVPRGALVQTGAGGGATLMTSGRETYVGASSSLRVVDGARQALTEGLAMVDARRAPSLSLETAAATVQVKRGAVLRVERGALLRVAAFSGSVSVTPTGRRAATAVDALYQVQVATGALPGAATPLALTSDRWERDLASDLVSEDTDLTALAAGLDGPGGAGPAVLSVVPTTLRSDAPVAAGAPRSEEALAFAIAEAARAGSVLERYVRVRALRDNGGSWGVVARLVGARVDGVNGVLEKVLEPNGPPGVAVGAPPGTDFGGLLIGGTPPNGPTSIDLGSVGSGTGGGTTGTTPRGSPGPGTPPVGGDPATLPSVGPGSVQQVVDAVVVLLPQPSGSPAPAPAPAPVPVPLPSPVLLPLPSPPPLPLPLPSPLVSIGGLGRTVG